MIALTNAERAMLDGESSATVDKEMDLLIRCAEVLGADRDAACTGKWQGRLA